MSNLVLKRLIKSPNSTIGMLYLDGAFECFTLELPWRNNQHNVSCIPAGEYALTIRYSERFKRDMPHIEGVPDRDGILIHWGNYPSDTDGCVLTGSYYNAQKPDFISESKMAFDILLARSTPGKITIEEG